MSPHSPVDRPSVAPQASPSPFASGGEPMSLQTRERHDPCHSARCSRVMSARPCFEESFKLHWRHTKKNERMARNDLKPMQHVMARRVFVSLCPFLTSLLKPPLSASPELPHQPTFLTTAPVLWRLTRPRHSAGLQNPRSTSSTPTPTKQETRSTSWVCSSKFGDLQTR